MTTTDEPARNNVDLNAGLHGRYINEHGTLADFGPPEYDTTHPLHAQAVRKAREERTPR